MKASPFLWTSVYPLLFFYAKFKNLPFTKVTLFINLNCPRKSKEGNSLLINLKFTCPPGVSTRPSLPHRKCPPPRHPHPPPRPTCPSWDKSSRQRNPLSARASGRRRGARCVSSSWADFRSALSLPPARGRVSWELSEVVGPSWDESFRKQRSSARSYFDRDWWIRKRSWRTWSLAGCCMTSSQRQCK